MNIKAFSLVLTLILLVFSGYFLVEYFHTCYACNPALSRAIAGEFDKPDIVFAMINFFAAIFSAYFITKRKFSTSAVLSGVVAGLQVAAVGTALFLAA